MARHRNKNRVPYAILGDAHEHNLRFYERYDEDFLFNKVATLLYVLAEGEPAVQQIEARLLAVGGGRLSDRYVESLRAEMFFTALHQCETFFALLIAVCQPLPHWVYLTTYETRDIKQAVERIVAHKIGDLTGGRIKNMRDLIKVAVYCEVMTADPELATRWEENVENAAWLVKHIGEFFLE